MPARHHGVTILNDCDRTYFMSAAQVVFIRLENSPASDLTFFYQVGHHFGHFFRSHLRIDTVLIIQVDIART